MRAAAAFGPRTARVFRPSCAVSLQNKAVETTRSLNRPGVPSEATYELYQLISMN